MNPANLSNACHFVARAPCTYGPGNREQFGGAVLFEESKTEEYATGTLVVGFTAGSYL